MYWNAVPTEEKQTDWLVSESVAIQMKVGLDLRLVFFELVIIFFSSLGAVGGIPAGSLIIADRRAEVYL